VDGGAGDSGVDAGPPDLGVDAGPPRCGTRPSGDTTWPQYRLPGTPGPAGGPPPTRNYMSSTDTVIDCVTGLEWQRAVDTMTRTRDDAVTYCNSLELAGYTDWRLPSRIELMTLVDYTIAVPGPTIDILAFPLTPADRFWSSSLHARSPSVGWFVAFNDGRANTFSQVNTCPVRCVR